MTELEAKLVDALERSETIIEQLVLRLRMAGLYDNSLADDVFRQQRRNVELAKETRDELWE